MSRVTELNLPPEEIYRKIWGVRKNVEHIILWLLKNNEVVEWADFLEKSPSTKRTLCELDDLIDELGAYGTESQLAKEALGQVLKDKSL